jgi:hypothetical protein
VLQKDSEGRGAECSCRGARVQLMPQNGGEFQGADAHACRARSNSSFLSAASPADRSLGL